MSAVLQSTVAVHIMTAKSSDITHVLISSDWLGETLNVRGGVLCQVFLGQLHPLRLSSLEQDHRRCNCLEVVQIRGGFC